MTDRSRGMAGAVSLALAVASLAGSACGTGKISCSCSSGGVVTLPASFTDSHIAGVTAGPTCTATAAGSDHIAVSSHTGGTCNLVVQLTDGTTWAVSVVFAQLDPDGCCAGAYSVVSTSAFLPLDGGVDGP